MHGTMSAAETFGDLSGTLLQPADPIVDRVPILRHGEGEGDSQQRAKGNTVLWSCLARLIDIHFGFKLRKKLCVIERFTERTLRHKSDTMLAM